MSADNPFAGIGQQFAIGGMDPRRHPPFVGQFGSGGDVIDVPVRQQHPGRSQLVRGQKLSDGGRGTHPRIDDDAR